MTHIKLSIDIDEAWNEPLRARATEAGYKSVREYLRSVIAGLINVPFEPKAWGGPRQVEHDAQVAPVDQVPQVELVAPLDRPSAPKNGRALHGVLGRPRKAVDEDDSVHYEDVND